jgi:hypothetical protein
MLKKIICCKKTKYILWLLIFLAITTDWIFTAFVGVGRTYIDEISSISAICLLGLQLLEYRLFEKCKDSK